jgi:hypothetical protein
VFNLNPRDKEPRHCRESTQRNGVPLNVLTLALLLGITIVPVASAQGFGGLLEQDSVFREAILIWAIIIGALIALIGAGLYYFLKRG